MAGQQWASLSNSAPPSPEPTAQHRDSPMALAHRLQLKAASPSPFPLLGIWPSHGQRMPPSGGPRGGLTQSHQWRYESLQGLCLPHSRLPHSPSSFSRQHWRKVCKTSTPSFSKGTREKEEPGVVFSKESLGTKSACPSTFLRSDKQSRPFVH